MSRMSSYINIFVPKFSMHIWPSPHLLYGRSLSTVSVWRPSQYFVKCTHYEAPNCLNLSLLMLLLFIWCWGMYQNFIRKVHCSNLCWKANCRGEVHGISECLQKNSMTVHQMEHECFMEFFSSSALTICLTPHGPSSWQLHNLRHFIGGVQCW